MPNPKNHQTSSTLDDAEVAACACLSQGHLLQGRRETDPVPAEARPEAPRRLTRSVLAPVRTSRPGPKPSEAVGRVEVDSRNILVPIAIYAVTSPLTYRVLRRWTSRKTPLVKPRVTRFTRKRACLRINSALGGIKWATPMSFKSLVGRKSGKPR